MSLDSGSEKLINRDFNDEGLKEVSNGGSSWTDLCPMMFVMLRLSTI